MSDAGAKIAFMKVLTKKVGAKLSPVFAAMLGDVSSKVDEKKIVGAVADQAKRIGAVARTVKKSSKYYDYVGKGFDDAATRAVSSVARDIKEANASGSVKVKEALAKRIGSQYRMNIDASDISDASKLVGKVKGAAKKQIIDHHTANWMGELRNYGGDERLIMAVAEGTRKPTGVIRKMVDNKQIESFVNNLSLDDTDRLNKTVYSMLSASRYVASETQRKVNKFSTTTVLSGNLSDKLSVMADVFNENGNEAGYLACKQAHSYLRNASAMETVFAKAKLNTANLFEDMAEEKQKAVRRYIDKKNIKGMMPKSNEKQLVNGDWRLAEELGLSVDDVAAANKINNNYRVSRFAEYKRARARTSQEYDDAIRESLSAFDNIDGSDVLFKDTDFSLPGMGDYGPNYTHVSITDAHRHTVREAIAKENPGMVIDWNNHGQKQAAYNRSKNFLGSKALEDDTLRRLPIEESNMYFDSVINNNTHNAGKELIDNIGKAATIFDVLNNSAKLNPNHTEYTGAYRHMINNINGTFDNIFAFQQQPDNPLTKFMAAHADVNTAAALGQSITSLTNLIFGDAGKALEGSRMPFFNFFQVIGTTAMFKGLFPTLGAIKDTSSFTKAYLKAAKMNGVYKKLTNKSNIELAIDMVRENTQDETLNKAISDYWKYENPDVLMRTYYTMDSRIGKAMDSITTMFKMSDISARHVGLTASVNWGGRQYDKHAASIMRGHPKAIDRLTKDMHLFEFGSLDREYILEAAMNRTEMLSRFARTSVRYELFNYSRYFRPQVLDQAKKHWATARATRFLSWNMYYTNLLKGVHRSYENGDKAPLHNLIKLNAAWLGTMYAANQIDDPTLDSFVRYGIGRTPGVAPAMNIINTSSREMAGILTPSLSTLAAPALKAFDVMNDTFGSSKDQNMFDYAWQKSYTNIKSQPVARIRPLKDLIDIIDPYIK